MTHQTSQSGLSRPLRGLQRYVFAAAFGVAALASTSANAQVYLGGSVSGQLAPGVYGRVDIGNSAPPALIYQQPVIIAPQPMAVHRAPIYMYVPPGHAKNWGKHCGRYSACGQPVYFLQEPPRYRAAPPPPAYRPHHDRERWEDRRDHRRDDHRHDRRNERWQDRDDDRGHRRHGRD